jgi:hypothetical protein
LVTVEEGLEVGTIANIQHLVGDIESDLTREERRRLDTRSDCAEIL